MRATSEALKWMTLARGVLFTSFGCSLGSPLPYLAMSSAAIWVAAGCSAVSTPRSKRREASDGILWRRAERAMVT